MTVDARVDPLSCLCLCLIQFSNSPPSPVFWFDNSPLSKPWKLIGILKIIPPRDDPSLSLPPLESGGSRMTIIRLDRPSETAVN